MASAPDSSTLAHKLSEDDGALSDYIRWSHISSNLRGYNPDDLEYEIVAYATTDTRDYFHIESRPDMFPPPSYPNVDYAVVAVTYPDGHTEYRTFTGPIRDPRAIEDKIVDWMDDSSIPTLAPPPKPKSPRNTKKATPRKQAPRGIPSVLDVLGAGFRKLGNVLFGRRR